MIFPQIGNYLEKIYILLIQGEHDHGDLEDEGDVEEEEEEEKESEEKW